VDPSRGNLHPTEAYLICGPIAASTHGLLPAGLYHYAPKSHALELLARIKEESWQDQELPKINTASCSYLYLLGHALVAVGVAARCLGWQALMEEEHADLLLAIHTGGSKRQLSLQSSDISKLKLERESRSVLM